MESNSSLVGFLRQSPIRSAKVSTACGILIAIGLFLFLALTTNEGDFGSGTTTGLLWLSAGASVLLPVLIVAHTGYDVIGWLQSRGQRESQGNRNSPIGLVLRVIEFGLGMINLAVVGFFAHLVATQSGGQGVGGIAIGIILIASTVSILLSVVVLLRAAIKYLGFGGK